MGIGGFGRQFFRLDKLLKPALFQLAPESSCVGSHPTNNGVFDLCREFAFEVCDLFFMFTLLLSDLRSQHRDQRFFFFVPFHHRASA